MADEWSKTCDISTLTERILTEIIQKGENSSKFEVLSWDPPKRMATGDHYASLMYNIHIHLKNAGGSVVTEETIDVIAKILPEAGEMRNFMMDSSSFPTEIKMYRDTLPKMLEVLNRSALSKIKTFGPKFYYGSDSLPYFLFLENVSPLGYVMVDKRKGLDLDHSLLVMKTIGRFHGASACLKQSDIDQYSTNFYNEKSSESLMDNFVSSTLKNLGAVVEHFPEKGSIYAGKLRLRAKNIMPGVRESMKPTRGSFNVLNHGDLWINNMLFRYDDGAVKDLMLVDFQQCIFGSPAIDLQHVINTSVREDVRAGREEQLLKEYHESLCETLKQAGFAKKAISFRELLEEFDKMSLYGLYAAMAVQPTILYDPEGPCDNDIKQKVKNLSINELNKLTGVEFIKFLKRILPVYLEKGIL